MNKKNNIRITQFDHFTWIDITDPSEGELQEYQIPEHFIEDIKDVSHLPKLENHKDYRFLILRAFISQSIEHASDIDELTGKISFFFNQKELITIHSCKFGFLQPDKFTANNPEALILKIAYEILKTYSLPITIQENIMDQFEKEIFLKDGGNLELEELYFEKSKARISRKILVVTKDILNKLNVSDNNHSLLNDLHDYINHQILSFGEILDDTTNLLNSYLAIKAQKSNNVMELLTIFSAFFLPITFIAGIYGMNFDKMPELHHPYGYFYTLLTMVVISLVIYIWFKRKKIL